MKRQKIEGECNTDVSGIAKDLEEEYKRQIEFYKAEEKIAKAQLREQEINFIRQKQELESKLENQIAMSSDLKLQVLTLQREIAVLKGNLTTLPQDQEVEELKGKLEKTQSDNVRLNAMKLERDEYIALGFVNPTRHKVVHLKDNPLHTATSQHPPPPSTPQSVDLLVPPPSTPSISPANQEADVLKKRIERMKELFASQTNRFRDAVYQLTGWNIDLSLHESRLRLRSRYANNCDDFIELVWNGTDQFELLDTSFINSLNSQLFTFITISHSFPAFLSAVTQDLFEKQTIYTTPS